MRPAVIVQVAESVGRRAQPRVVNYKHGAILRRRGWTEVRWMELQAQAQAQSSRMLTEELQCEAQRREAQRNSEEFKAPRDYEERILASENQRLDIATREADALENVATVLREMFHHKLNNPGF